MNDAQGAMEKRPTVKKIGTVQTFRSEIFKEQRLIRNPEVGLAGRREVRDNRNVRNS
jgi:antitoxin PrlF